VDALVTLRSRKLPRSGYKSDWRQLLSANVTVMTPCNRRCPDCCCGDVVFREKGRIFSAEEIARDIVQLGDVGTVLLTGGEPTLHPDFPAVAEAARAARGGGKLTLVTAGARLVKHAASMRFFDTIRMSVFDESSNAGESTTPGIVEEFRKVCPEGVNFEPALVVHYRSSGPNPCERVDYTISTMGGRVYACCVASGISGASSTELSEGWEERLLGVDVPCDKCVFGEAT
jgi:hypothetical protein